MFEKIKQYRALVKEQEELTLKLDRLTKFLDVYRAKGFTDQTADTILKVMSASGINETDWLNTEELTKPSGNRILMVYSYMIQRKIVLLSAKTNFKFI